MTPPKKHPNADPMNATIRAAMRQRPDATKTPTPDKGSADAMGEVEQYDELHKANVAKDTDIITQSPPLYTISGFKSGSAELPSTEGSGTIRSRLSQLKK